MAAATHLAIDALSSAYRIALRTPVHLSSQQIKDDLRAANFTTGYSPTAPLINPNGIVELQRDPSPEDDRSESPAAEALEQTPVPNNCAPSQAAKADQVMERFERRLDPKWRAHWQPRPSSKRGVLKAAGSQPPEKIAVAGKIFEPSVAEIARQAAPEHIFEVISAAVTPFEEFEERRKHKKQPGAGHGTLWACHMQEPLPSPEAKPRKRPEDKLITPFKIAVYLALAA